MPLVHEQAPPAPSQSEAIRVWAKIGLLSFGGPAGQIALMHRELVEQRRWIGEARFLHALNYCMLLPGPEAQQLATYVGWLMHGTRGGLVAGLLFVLPGALVMLALSVLYVLYRQVPLVDAAFLGIKAAVIAIVIEAVIRIGRRALRNWLTVAVAVLAFLALFAFAVPFPLVIVLAGLAGWFGAQVHPGLFIVPGANLAGAGDTPSVVDGMFARGELEHAQPSMRHAFRVLAIWLPLWLAPPALLWLMRGEGDVLTQIGGFFSLLAVVTFGGAYAVLAYVAQAAVGTFGWLAPGEMADGLGLAETTPGPLILVLQFVGFLAAFRDPGTLPPLVAGALGAALTLWVTFAPCFLWIFLGGPWIEALRGNRRLSAAMTSITAAVVGVILNLAVWFALHVLFAGVQTFSAGPLSLALPRLDTFQAPAALIATAAAFALLRLKAGVMVTLAGAAVLGLAARAAGLA